MMDMIDDVLEALDLDPETFRTEGGAINRGKLRAAILHPAEYLTPDHWLQARRSVLEQIEALTQEGVRQDSLVSTQAFLYDIGRLVRDALEDAADPLAEYSRASQEIAEPGAFGPSSGESP